MNPMQFLFSLIRTVVVDIMGAVIIPGIGVNIWDFTIYLAASALVISVLITSVRSGVMISANSSKSKGKKGGK